MNYPYSYCLHPRNIRNSAGDIIQVPCGTCKACLMHKASYYENLCELQEQDFKYTVFFTLTYANEYVPRFRYVLRNDKRYGKYYSFHPVARFLPYYHKKDIHHKFKHNLTNIRFNTLIYKDSVYKDFCHYHKKFGVDFIPSISRKQKCNDGEILSVSKLDLQLFFKRFRNLLKTRYEISEKVQYFVVAEYGPKTFRPHYHGLLYFNDRRTFEVYSDALHSAWLYGRIDFSTSRGKCGGYCAKYVNSVATLPHILQVSSFLPFKIHSNFFGLSFYKDAKEEIYKSDFRSVVNHVRRVCGKDKDVSVWRSFKSCLFPKVREFNTASSRKLFLLYTCFPVLSKIYHTESISEIAWNCFQDRKTSSLFSYGVNHPNIHTYYLFTDDFKYLDIFDRTSGGKYKSPLSLADIEHDLFISKHFFKFVCNSDINLVTGRIDLIKKFYSCCELLALKNFYQKQSECEDIYENLLYNNYIPSEDEILPTLEGLTIYKQYSLNINERFSNSIKHKEINDLNKIFIYG